MELSGKVTNIIYYNDKNGYTIFLLKTEKKTETCVGYVPYINVKDVLQLQGDFVTHSIYGNQFKIETFEKIVPTSEEELLDYLSSGAIKGLGEKTAKRIIQEFGKESIEIIKADPERLANIKGISLDKALQLQETVNSDWYFLQLVKFLNGYSIGVKNAKKIFQEWGENSIDLINENPYSIVDIVDGVEFGVIDKIASELNFEKDNVNRIASGVKYCLSNTLYRGNTCGKYEDLIKAVTQFLGVNSQSIENALVQMINNKDIVIEYRDKEDITKDKFVYLYNIYHLEQDIADIVKSKINIVHNLKNVDKRLKKIENQLGICLTDNQRQAINMAYNYNLSIVTGGPGTGKTTIIQCLIRLFEEDKKEVALCAPTGRAAKRITDITGKEASTIHRMLEINKLDENLSRVRIDVGNIYKDVVIVDEASMLDTVILGHILKAIQSHTKLILIGDVDQLPSVGPGDVLKNLIEYRNVKYMYLTEIFRQAKESLIVINAHKINTGDYPILNVKDKDCIFIPMYNQADVAKTIANLCKGDIQNYLKDIQISDMQVISPTKKGTTGTKELNKLIQEYVNPKEEAKKEKNYGQNVFRVGDKVMHIKNDYEIEWFKNGYIGQGIFNGDMGVVTDYDYVANTLEVTFDDDRVANYTSANIEELEHAYAITVHKSQGSEFEVVVMPILAGPPMLYTRNLLYTGITRAKKLLILIGDENQIRRMVDNVEHKKRITGLEFKLNGENA